MQIEILGPGGEACGDVTVPRAPAEPDVTTRVVMSVDVGQDGTVIASESLSGSSLGPGRIHCEFRWWPALLR